MNRLLSWSSIGVMIGGILIFLINAGITPLLDQDLPFTETASSSLFLVRQGLSALAAIFLLFGSIGLYLNQINSTKLFGHISFIFALLGSALLLANEWNQIFIISELAAIAPDTLLKLDSSESMGLFNVGSMLALFTFTIGWILFSISMIRAKVYSKNAPILIISGFFAIPIFTAIFGIIVGGILGNAVLGFGFLLVGRDLYFVNTSIKKS